MTRRGWLLGAGSVLVAALGAGVPSASAALTPAARPSVLGGVPALAAAHADASSSGLTTTLITFTPVEDTTGEQIEFTAFGCGKGQQFSATYSQRRGNALRFHDYAGELTSCHLDSTFTSGTLSARWSTALRLNLTLTAKAKPKFRRTRISKGCYETTTEATYLATGSVRAAVHGAQLGTLSRTRLTANFDRISVPNCVFASSGTASFSFTSTGASSSGSLAALQNGDQLQALWGANESIGALKSRGMPTTLEFTEPAHDGPTPTVTDTFGLELVGGGAFSPAANLTGATLNFASPVSAGRLTFTAGVGCPPTIRATDGTFSGSATVDDPVLGKVRIAGPLMSEGQLSIVSADSYKCAPVNFGEE
jgi:hypothetical protein